MVSWRHCLVNGLEIEVLITKESQFSTRALFLSSSKLIQMGNVITYSIKGIFSNQNKDGVNCEILDMGEAF